MTPTFDLPEQHGRIEKLLSELSETVRADDHQLMCRLWTAFERELTQHMEAEEKDLLPAFAGEFPDDSRALLAEHSEIRRVMGELGVAVDLRLVRVEAIDALVARLRAHARHEDEMFYRWVRRQPRPERAVRVA